MREKTLIVTGNILKILEGAVTENDIHTVEASRFHFALGGSSFSHSMHIGETIVIDGKAYVTWVEDQQLQTQAGKTIYSPFLMGIEKNDNKFEAVIDVSTPLQDLYEQFAAIEKMGFAVAGSGYFSAFHSTYLQKAPIYHENVNEHADIYWHKSPPAFNVPICFFGIVIGQEGKKKFQASQLSRAFYENPLDTGTSPILSHTHGVFLKNTEPPGLDKLETIEVAEVRHVLPQSIFEKGKLYIFPIQEIEV